MGSHRLLQFLIISGSPTTGLTGGRPLRFAYQDRIGSVMPILAVKKDFFRQAQLDLTSLRFSSGPACAEALFSGAADVAAMGDTAAIIMVVRSPRFVIIASHATGEHRHRIMVRADSGLQRIEDLKGMRIGVKKGTSTYGGLLSALEKAHLSADALQMIDLNPSIMTDALLAGSIDAFAASEPTPSSAEQKGARELTTLGGLGNLYPILILADRRRFSDDSGTLRHFLLALRRAEGEVAAHPEATVAMMAGETGLNPITTRAAMGRHAYRMRMDGEIRASLEQTARFLKDQGIIDRVPDFSACTTAEFLNP